MKFLIFLVLLINQAYANIDKQINVNGDCLKDIESDRASILISIRSTNPDAQTAYKQSQKIYNQYREQVKKLNLKNLELNSQDFYMGELVDWEKNKRMSKGYEAKMSIQVSTSDIARIGEAINIANQIGVKDFSNLANYVSEQKWKDERESCLEQSILNAKSKAERLAKASGAKLGKVLQINESFSAPMPGGPEFTRSAMMPMSAKMEMGGSAPVIESSVKKMNVSLNVIFAID